MVNFIKQLFCSHNYKEVERYEIKNFFNYTTGFCHVYICEKCGSVKKVNI